MTDRHARTVFFISDGTGITAETLGHSLLTQFEGIDFRQMRLPFVSTLGQARECLLQIRHAAERDGIRPIVVTTLVDPNISKILREADALFLEFTSRTSTGARFTGRGAVQSRTLERSLPWPFSVL